MSVLKTEFDRAVEFFNNSESPLKRLVTQKSMVPLILYGCGTLCHYVLSVCNTTKTKVVALCDSYKTGSFEDTGLKILSPEQVKQKYPDAKIVICSHRYEDEIDKNLNALGFSKKQIYHLPADKLQLIYPSDFARKYLSGYEWAYNFFPDTISKQIIIDRTKLYINGTELVRTSNAPQYFDDGIIRFDMNEVFVDGGAFTGDTAEEFIRQCKKHGVEYHHIYSFEPDDNARQRAICNLKKYENTDIIGKGLWSCDTDLKFYNDGGCASSSFTYGVRTISVPVMSIDHFFADKPVDEWPTFIKMDIEGSEKEALIGAKNVIGRKHPKLAICVYHKPEDIYELPQLIYEIDPSYKFTLRQCINGIYETVLYAV